MKSELPVNGVECSAVMPNNQNYEDRSLKNISLQTGEEFCPAFMFTRTLSRRNLNADVVVELNLDASKNIASIQGTRRRNSDCSTEFADFSPRKGFGYEMDISPAGGYTGEPYAYTHHRRILSDDLDKFCTTSPYIHSSDSFSSFSKQVKFLCSYGGRIVPRPNDGKLRYIGGETKIASIRTDLAYAELLKKTSAMCNYPHAIKYQLPGEDLDALISVASDEDLRNMIEEYNDLERSSQRLKLFLISYNDIEAPLGSIQHSNGDRHHIAAINEILDPGFHGSSRKENLEVHYVDDKPSPQMNMLLRTPSFRGHGDARSKHGSDVSFQCLEDDTSYKYPCLFDASAPFQISPPLQETGCSQSYATPTLGSLNRHDFQSVSPYGCPSYSDVVRIDQAVLPLQSEKSVAFFPEKSHLRRLSRSSLERIVEEQITPEKCVSSTNKVPVSQETLIPNKDFIDWGEQTQKATHTLEKKSNNEMEGYSFDKKMSDFLEGKTSLPQMGNPDILVPVTLQETRGFKNSSLSTSVSTPLQDLAMISVNDQTTSHLLALKYQMSGKEQIIHEKNINKPEFLGPFIFSESVASSPMGFDDCGIYTGVIEMDALGAEVSWQKKRLKDDLKNVEVKRSGRYPYREVDAGSENFANPLSSGKNSGTFKPETPVILDVGTKLPFDISAASISPRMQLGDLNEMRSLEVESIVYDCEDDDVKGEDDMDISLSDAAMIEIEASIYGLQIIRNADLEDLKELGSGTFGTVYHGRWRGTDVAIKRIRKSCFAGRSSEQERLSNDFWREAKILSRLHHPNIVAFYGVVPDGPDCTFATVTEYMANGSLRRIILRKDRSLDRRKKVMIALDAAFGMEYLHLKNIVHFDLKCDNLLVNLGDPQRPICKVGDFGLSRIKQNTLVSGGVRGTLPWMAPELLNGGSNRVSEKVDVFSFGIAMWEILTGEEPYMNMQHEKTVIIHSFTNLDNNILLLFNCDVEGGIVNNTLRPTIPERCDPEWRKLMEECWSHDPTARPSFTEITKRLRVLSTTLASKRYDKVRR